MTTSPSPDRPAARPGRDRENRRVLVLTSSTGGGHDMRARALQAWSRTGEGRRRGLHVEIHQTLENTHGVYEFGVRLYNRIQQFWPKLHHLYFHFLEHAGLHDAATKIWGRDRFLRRVRDFRPHLLVSTHAHLNHGFFELARWGLPDQPLRTVTYCGELAGGYGFSRHWVNPRVDLFMGAVEETCGEAAHLGVPEERLWRGGFLLHPDFYGEAAPDSRAQLCERLQLDPGRFLLVLSTGANGANNHLRALRALRAARVHPQVIALCGRSTETVTAVEEWGRRHPELTVRALPFVDQMRPLLQSADALVARAGTGTTSEAILTRCPLIFNGIGGSMPQEELTLKYARKYGFGRRLSRTHQLPGIVREWMTDPGRLRAESGTMARIAPDRHPLMILDRLASLVP